MESEKQLTKKEIAILATELADQLEAQTDGQCEAIQVITIAASLLFSCQCELICKR